MILRAMGPKNNWLQLKAEKLWAQPETIAKTIPPFKMTQIFSETQS